MHNIILTTKIDTYLEQRCDIIIDTTKIQMKNQQNYNYSNEGLVYHHLNFRTFVNPVFEFSNPSFEF